ncbi:retrotransposon gag domain-containing protein, partial [Pantoea sp. GbtcB22]|uniref:retrotransposon gag domain-containing protein n=1 Tax=Pantoea sp. GbtcB22 TaxID=2824767 RepID=UPI001C2F147D
QSSRTIAEKCGLGPAAFCGQVTWEEFLEDFRKYHLPEAARDLKAEEFRKLKLNTKTMQEYIEKFTTLSRYAPVEVNTE